MQLQEENWIIDPNISLAPMLNSPRHDLVAFCMHKYSHQNVHIMVIITDYKSGDFYLKRIWHWIFGQFGFASDADDIITESKSPKIKYFPIEFDRDTKYICIAHH